MKTIPLTKGQFTVVDDDIFDELIKYKWQAKYNKCTQSYYAAGYVYFKGKSYTTRMHRIIMGIDSRDIYIDHIDHDTLNNQRHNLRIATHSQNMANRRPNRNAASKYLGVDYHNDKFRARITPKDRKQIHLGYFINEKDAALAYDKAAKELYGEFANPNFKTA